MACVVNQPVTTLCPRFFEIFKPLDFNQIPELFTGPRRHLAEQSEFTAETIEAFTQKTRTFFFSFLRKRKAEIDLAGSPEVTGQQVSDFAKRPANPVCGARRQSTKRGEDELDRRVF